MELMLCKRLSASIVESAITNQVIVSRSNHAPYAESLVIHPQDVSRKLKTGIKATSTSPMMEKEKRSHHKPSSSIDAL
ncbi:hypothetical protein GOP47_0025299 [Adiantum capillus-veneris]|uniref:Uncharacterized protein n=1 Tax=Adiantum capillus-veneris TaxID=13818 RepID=A0A9D4U189_ADICA|nr:hypothetical protein GOP47_0025299 [Adiantum capillus-veneris]